MTDAADVPIGKVRIVYSTEGFLYRNKGKVGESTEPREFESVEDAKNAPFPDGCSFAHISADDGYHVYSPSLGWEFHELATTEEFK